MFFLLNNLLYGMFGIYAVTIGPNTAKEMVSAKIRPNLNYKTLKTTGVHVPTVRMAPVINFVT